MKKKTKINCVLGAVVALTLSSTYAFALTGGMLKQGTSPINDSIKSVSVTANSAVILEQVASPTEAVTATAVTTWMWDQDANGIDDRIEAVNNFGLKEAYENNDVINGRLHFAVFDGEVPQFGVYVGFKNSPTEVELDQLRQSGVNVEGMKAYQSIPYVRMVLNFQDIQTVSKLADVTRVESIPMMYATNNNANKASGVVASDYKRFPSVHENLGITGKGVVVGILDTGVNDAPDSITGYPGHESLAGKFIAGGEFSLGNLFTNTANDASMNPIDRGESSTHGTHVAGTAIGGGPGSFGGVAPGAMLVDAKVLSDAGTGAGAADGVEWAIINKEKFGIRILNLSLGGTNSSDGTDAGSQGINAAYDAGIISVIASGNDGNVSYISSPAAADKAITVGAIADLNSITREDDMIADFSNEGPRTDDGDADRTDEMKPEIAAPGAGLVSAKGALRTDGRQYTAKSGTSMATPHVAGVIALMLEAYPAMTVEQIDATIRHTAEHRFDWGKNPESERPFKDIDPNYHPSGGWGQVDAYAAVKEALYLAGDAGSQTQVVHIFATPDEAAQSITLNWTSQRETNLVGYDVYRAPDNYGVPGDFEKITSSLIGGKGRPEIAGVNNRNHYSFIDTDPNLTVDKTYWYRIDHTSQLNEVGTVEEPAYPVLLGTLRTIAYLDYSITHNSIGSDLYIILGSGAEPGHAKVIIHGASTQEAVITDDVGDPLGTIGNLRHDFRIALTNMDGVTDLLSPSKRNRWFLSVNEGGFLNRNGRVNSFSISMVGENGKITETFHTDAITPQQTVEENATTLWIPDDPGIVEAGDSPTLIDLSPNSGEQSEVITLEIYGAEMLPGSTVDVSGMGVVVSNVTYVSGTRLSADFTIAATAEMGAYNVTVTNPDGETDTLDNGFTVGNPGNGDDNEVETQVIHLDNANRAIKYDNSWERFEYVEASNYTYHEGSTDSMMELDFTGSQVTLMYGEANEGGTAAIYIDGIQQADLSFSGTSRDGFPDFNNQVIYGDLDQAEHTFKLVMLEGPGFIDGFKIVSEK
ncbi:MAG: subtilisin family serine protease [Paraglaciecola sp.]|jgi:subtilisin family serine protease